MRRKKVLRWYHFLFLGILTPSLTAVGNAAQVWLYVDYSGALKSLTNDGETDIHLIGYRAGGCYDNTPIHTEFSAIDPYGLKVTGVVCSTTNNGSIIHFDQY